MRGSASKSLANVHAVTRMLHPTWLVWIETILNRATMVMIPKKLQLRFFSMLASLLILIGAFYYADKTYELQQLKITEGNLVPAIGNEVSALISDITADLKALSNSRAVIDYLDSPSTTTLSRLQERFLTFAQAYGKYHQVRLLNLAGQEQVRVNCANGKTLLVPDEQLQNKADRYYFTNAISLDKGVIYISRFDLNLEQGKVETPWRPMIRLATPMFDSAGQRKGVLILNYLGHFILDELRLQDIASQGQLMLINDQGFWLYHPNWDKCWGFMFGQDERFQNIYTAAWDRLLKSKEGQFQTDNGLFTYLTIYPPAVKNGHTGTLPGTDLWWTLVSVVPADALNPKSEQRLSILFKLSPVLLLLLAMFAWFWTWLAQQAEQGKARILELSRVVEQSHELVFITDPRGVIHYVNPAFENITGYNQEEVIGKTPRILKSGIHDEAFYSRLWQSIIDGKVFEGVFINKRRDGSRYYEEKIITPIHDEKGNLVQFVSTGRDISKLTLLEERSAELHRLAYRDTLTKLPNRLFIIDHLKDAMNRAKRRQKLMAAVFIDLDDFKLVNDTYGHQIGDRLLASYADRAQQFMRKIDTLGRLGGDEFILIMEDFERVEDVEHTLDKLLKHSTMPFELDGHSIQISASVGVTLHPFADVDHETLWAQADSAMYHAKKTGKNQVVFYTAQLMNG